jgi:putative YjhG/YagF family dehydratase
MVVHAAFGGSTNLLLHIPAIAHAAGLRRPTVADWAAVNRSTPRLVDVLPNGPTGHPTVRAFLAGGVPEVMCHLAELGLLHLDARTVEGERLGDRLDAWAKSERRAALRARLQAADGVDPDDVILSPAAARARGLTSTVTFPVGNLAPQGSVVKSTAIDAGVVDPDGVYRKRGPARVFTSERAAIAAIKGQPLAGLPPAAPIQPGDILVLMGRGPLGCGMEETYQVTSALKHLPWGKEVALITDARFSGVSTGACIGHIGPEALAGGPLGKLRDGDLIAIVVDRVNLTGSLDLVGHDGEEYTPAAGAAVLAARSLHPDLAPDPDLPADTRLWAALQQASGGIWGGCVYDVDAILTALSQAPAG